MKALLEAHNISKHYPLRGQSAFGIRKGGPVLKAVDDVSFDIQPGEVLGLVGESGSGKSTLGRLLLNLIPPTSGKVLFKGEDLNAVSASRMRALRRKMQVIFQDPYASLNPRMTIAETLIEGVRLTDVTDRTAQRRRAAELLDAVGLNAAYLERYPHMFSGGQRQRIAIARALSVRPDLIIADEPVSALDVSIQAQVLNLLADLREEFGLTYLFISHDLNVIRYLSDRVAVMHLGRIVELAPATDLFERPQHPYTRALMEAAPRMDVGRAGFEEAPAKADATMSSAGFTGCRYKQRCPIAMDVCTTTSPPLVQVGPQSWTACHAALPGEDDRSGESQVERQVDAMLAITPPGPQ